MPTEKVDGKIDGSEVQNGMMTRKDYEKKGFEVFPPERPFEKEGQEIFPSKEDLKSRFPK